jgi:hypothetical protein
VVAVFCNTKTTSQSHAFFKINFNIIITSTQNFQDLPYSDFPNEILNEFLMSPVHATQLPHFILSGLITGIIKDDAQSNAQYRSYLQQRQQHDIRVKLLKSGSFGLNIVSRTRKGKATPLQALTGP